METQNDAAATSVQSVVSTPSLPFEAYYRDDSVTIYNMDCRKILPWLDGFDLLLTDPPYGIGDRWGGGKMTNTKGQTSRLWETDSGEWDAAPIESWLIQSMIEKSQVSIIWGGNYYGLPPSRCWLTWDKCQTFTGADAELAWTTLDKPVATWRMARVEAYKPSKNGGVAKVHPTQKPLGLIQWCIGMAGTDIATILDPFMGSGTTLVASKLEGRKAVGIEISERYCESAAKRLSQGVLF